MKRIIMAAAIAVLPAFVCAGELPGPHDPAQLAHRIEADIEPLCQKQQAHRQFLCDVNLEALIFDVWYMDSPEARARLIKAFGGEEEARFQIEAHGRPATYEEIVLDYHFQLDAWGK